MCRKPFLVDIAARKADGHTLRGTFGTTQLNSTTSMRPLVHSCGQLLWTDVGLSTTRQEGTATRFCVTVHNREHPLRRAGACGRPNWACGYSQGRPFETKTYTLLNDTEEKSLLNSAPGQAERPEKHHRIPTLHSIPLAIPEMLLSQSRRCKKNLEKRHQPDSICPQYFLNALHSRSKSCSHRLDKEIKQRMED